MEEVAEAVGGGYCLLQMPLKLAFAVRETVAGHGLGPEEGGATSPSSNAHPWVRPPCTCTSKGPEHPVPPTVGAQAQLRAPARACCPCGGGGGGSRSFVPTPPALGPRSVQELQCLTHAVTCIRQSLELVLLTAKGQVDPHPDTDWVMQQLRDGETPLVWRALPGVPQSAALGTFTNVVTIRCAHFQVRWRRPGSGVLAGMHLRGRDLKGGLRSG